MAMSRDDRDPSPRGDRSYVPPPNIRTTGELPAVTGEIRRIDAMPPSPQPADPGSNPIIGLGRAPGGRVVDRPAVSAPDWMSGVDVPELVVTREFGAEAARPADNRVAELAQRVLGLVLVALLAAVVALVAIGSIFGFR